MSERLIERPHDRTAPHPTGPDCSGSICTTCGCCWCCDPDCCAEYTCPNTECGCSMKERATYVLPPSGGRAS